MFRCMCVHPCMYYVLICIYYIYVYYMHVSVYVKSKRGIYALKLEVLLLSQKHGNAIISFII